MIKLQPPKFMIPKFFYDWNTAKTLVQQYYSSLQKQKGKNHRVIVSNIMSGYTIELCKFNLQTLVQNFSEDHIKGNRSIILLTASTNYPFGYAQKKFFEFLRDKYPGWIFDILVVGHCMYGCQSCGMITLVTH
jgi:hypothetical protein